MGIFVRTPSASRGLLLRYQRRGCDLPLLNAASDAIVVDNTSLSPTEPTVIRVSSQSNKMVIFDAEELRTLLFSTDNHREFSDPGATRGLRAERVKPENGGRGQATNIHFRPPHPETAPSTGDHSPLISVVPSKNRARYSLTSGWPRTARRLLSRRARLLRMTISSQSPEPLRLSTSSPAWPVYSASSRLETLDYSPQFELFLSAMALNAPNLTPNPARPRAHGGKGAEWMKKEMPS